MIIVIDPGLKKQGVALFDDAGRLLRAALVKVNTNQRGAYVWRLLAQETKNQFPDVPRVVVHEMMTPRRGQEYASADLLEVVGSLAWTLSKLCDSSTEIKSFTPQEWKGNLPKEITQRRAKAALMPDELIGSGKWNHDVWDAVSIGLVYCHRMR